MMASITVANTTFEFTPTPEQLAALGEKAAYSNSQKQEDEEPWASDLAYFEWVMGVWYSSQTPTPDSDEIAAKVTSTLNSYAAIETPVEIPSEDLSPSAAKAKLVSYLSNKRWELEVGGMIFSGMKVPTDDRAKILLMGAAGSMTNEDTASFNVDGVAITLTGLQFKTVYNEITRRTRLLFDIEGLILNEINTNKITSKEQIDAWDWSV